MEKENLLNVTKSIEICEKLREKVYNKGLDLLDEDRSLWTKKASENI